MYDNNNNNDNKSTIFSFLKTRPSWVSDVQNSGFYWLRVLNGCRLFILRTLGVCLFVCLFYIKRKVVFRVPHFRPSLVLLIGPFKKRFLNKLALSISPLICTLVRAYFCFHPLSYRSFVFSSKHVHVLFAVSRFSSIISFNSIFFSAVCDFSKNKKKLALIFDKNNQISVNRKTFSGKVKLLVSVTSYRRLFTHSNYFGRKKVALD